MLVAVTGGGGFIGSHLIRALRDDGVEVRTLLGPPGTPVVMPPADVATLSGEIDDATVLMPLVRDATAIVHLAGPPSVAASFQAPLAYARAHTNGTAAVVDACIRSGVRRLVYVSSAEVYGQPSTNPVREDAPLAPRSPYAAAKIGAEAFVRAGSVAGGLEAAIFSPFLVYGPGMPSRTLVGSLVRQARQGSVIEVADPRPIRDYCFVGDLVGALVAGCSAALPEPVRIYNLGSGLGISVADLAERVVAMAGVDASVRVAQTRDRPPRTDILELVSDSSRAAAELAWHATTHIDHGLAEMLRLPIGVDR